MKAPYTPISEKANPNNTFTRCVIETLESVGYETYHQEKPINTWERLKSMFLSERLKKRYPIKTKNKNYWLFYNNDLKSMASLMISDEMTIGKAIRMSRNQLRNATNNGITKVEPYYKLEFHSSDFGDLVKNLKGVFELPTKPSAFNNRFFFFKRSDDPRATINEFLEENYKQQIRDIRLGSLIYS